MSVTVRYRDGTTGTYDEATSANLDSGLMRLSRWNTKKRQLEDVMTEGCQKTHEAFNGEATRTIAHQPRDVGLLNAQDFASLTPACTCVSARSLTMRQICSVRRQPDLPVDLLLKRVPVAGRRDLENEAPAGRARGYGPDAWPPSMHQDDREPHGEPKERLELTHGDIFDTMPHEKQRYAASLVDQGGPQGVRRLSRRGAG